MSKFPKTDLLDLDQNRGGTSLSKEITRQRKSQQLAIEILENTKRKHKTLRREPNSSQELTCQN